MSKVAILIPVCSRNQYYKSINETPLVNTFLPAFERTKDIDESISYHIFIGIDDNDEFYMDRVDEIEYMGFTPVVVRDCNHKPAMVWNLLLEVAYKTGFDYFFQIGDDVELLTPGWCTEFIEKLKETSNIGVVGPIDDSNYQWRISNNIHLIIENAFVHRSHFDIFGYMFHPMIENYYCDDWLTLVYGNRASIYMNIKCNNLIRHTRYNGKFVPNLRQYVAEGVEKVSNYISRKDKRVDEQVAN